MVQDPYVGFQQVVASANDDTGISPSSGDALFGLQGNDRIEFNTGAPNYALALGGRGSDTYTIQSGETGVVYDGFGSEGDVANLAGINFSTATAAEIDDRHLYIADTSDNTFAVIVDWRDPDHRIETFNLRGRTLSFEQAAQYIDTNQPGVLTGGISLEAALSGASFDIPFTANQIRSAVSYYDNAVPREPEAPGPGEPGSGGDENPAPDDGSPAGDRNGGRSDPAERGNDARIPPGLDTLVDDQYYREQNPDVAGANIDPDLHYVEFGEDEGRQPNAYFNPEYYAEQNSDVADSSMGLLQHYHSFGWQEGRDPSNDFDTSAYLSDHTDVDAAGVNPLVHYLNNGKSEGREITPVKQETSNVPSVDFEFSGQENEERSFTVQTIGSSTGNEEGVVFKIPETALVAMQAPTISSGTIRLNGVGEYNRDVSASMVDESDLGLEWTNRSLDLLAEGLSNAVISGLGEAIDLPNIGDGTLVGLMPSGTYRLQYANEVGVTAPNETIGIETRLDTAPSTDIYPERPSDALRIDSVDVGQQLDVTGSVGPFDEEDYFAFETASDNVEFAVYDLDASVEFHLYEDTGSSLREITQGGISIDAESVYQDSFEVEPGEKYVVGIEGSTFSFGTDYGVSILGA